MRAITKTNKRLVFKKKPFAKRPRLKHLLSKCNQIYGENYYQNVKLSNFEAFFNSFSCKKDKFLDEKQILRKTNSSIKDQLSEEIESNNIFESTEQILNTEGWEHEKIGHNGNTISDFEFADTHAEYLCEHFNIPFVAAGVKVSSVDLSNQWHELLRYSFCQQA